MAVIDLLTRGFPSRSRDYWTLGFSRERERRVPPGLARYGLLLESEGRPVGTILLLHAWAPPGEAAPIRCNLSSWYVEPAFRAHAATLVRLAVRQPGITYINISAAPHTIPIVEAQGFRRYAAGTFVGVPSLKRRLPRSRIHRIDGKAPRNAATDLPERRLLLDHAAMGCTSLVVEAFNGSHPFVFLPFRIRSGRVRPPAVQLIYCRAIDDYLRCAGILGRYWLWRGAPLVLHDADGAPPGFIGHFFDGVGPKFFLGPDRPRWGDLAYTERVIFGP